MDLNHRPHPYQYWAIMSRGMIQLVSVVARASRIGLMCAGVAVTVAVSISFGAGITDRDLNHPACTLRSSHLTWGVGNVLWSQPC